MRRGERHTRQSAYQMEAGQCTMTLVGPGYGSSRRRARKPGSLGSGSDVAMDECGKGGGGDLILPLPKHRISAPAT